MSDVFYWGEFTALSDAQLSKEPPEYFQLIPICFWFRKDAGHSLILFSQKSMSFGGPQKGGKGLGVGIKPFWHHLLPFDSGQDLAFASLSSSVRMMPVPVIMGEDVCVAQHQTQ